MDGLPLSIILWDFGQPSWLTPSMDKRNPYKIVRYIPLICHTNYRRSVGVCSREGGIFESNQVNTYTNSRLHTYTLSCLNALPRHHGVRRYRIPKAQNQVYLRSTTACFPHVVAYMLCSFSASAWHARTLQRETVGRKCLNTSPRGRSQKAMMFSGDGL